MLDKLGFPSVGSHGRFVTAIAVDAVGSGVFMPVAMLYFLFTTDLTLVQVGAAISIASLLSLPVGVLLGGAVDRYGAKRMLLIGNALQALGFIAYLFTESFASVLFWTVVVTIGRSAFWGSYGNIVAAISAPGEREKWFGFLGALRNVGFAVGGLVSGLAITIGTQAAYAGVVIANAVSYVVAFWLLLAVPATPRSEHGPQPGSWATVLRDRPYRLLWFCQLTFSMAMMVLNFALPVYATTVLGLSGWVTGAVFTINTVIVGFGQGLAVKAMTGARRWWMLLLANGFFVGSYAIMLGASRLSIGVAAAVVLIGSAVYTLGRGDRRPGAGGPWRGGRARTPARSLSLADPARLEHCGHGGPRVLRLAARPRSVGVLPRGDRDELWWWAARRVARADDAPRGRADHQSGCGAGRGRVIVS